MTEFVLQNLVGNGRSPPPISHPTNYRVGLAKRPFPIPLIAQPKRPFSPTISCQSPRNFAQYPTVDKFRGLRDHNGRSPSPTPLNPNGRSPPIIPHPTNHRAGLANSGLRQDWSNFCLDTSANCVIKLDQSPQDNGRSPSLSPLNPNGRSSHQSLSQQITGSVSQTTAVPQPPHYTTQTAVSHPPHHTTQTGVLPHELSPNTPLEWSRQ